MTKMFSKMIDILEEEAQKNECLGIIIDKEKIRSLLWVDDVATVAEGTRQQEKTLEFVDEFAKKHRLEWGVEKCNVLEIGKKNIQEKDRNQEKTTQTQPQTTNKDNIENRMKKVKQTTGSIIACGVMKL